jgi:hypothetical protein
MTELGKGVPWQSECTVQWVCSDPNKFSSQANPEIALALVRNMPYSPALLVALYMSYIKFSARDSFCLASFCDPDNENNTGPGRM